MAKVIISYDGTENDDDALALGKLLADPGDLALAYIRHSQELDPQREKVAQHDAEQRLRPGRRAARAPGRPPARGLRRLDRRGAGRARERRRRLDRRVRLGLPHPARARRAAQFRATAAGDRRHRRSLSRPPGCAPSRRSRSPRSLSSRPTATRPRCALPRRSPASACGQVTGLDGAGADLIVVGSQPGAPAGRVALSGAARTALDASRGSVLVVPSGKPLGG